jgi:Adenylate and Guanylate cyclase catalytic domain/Double zinc ribbon
MRCPGCQHENREGRRFCSECGASLAFLCAACGFSNEPGEKFCGGCGQPLLSSAQQSTPKSVSPVAYTTKHLAEKILTSKVALEGERKQVTVLFADLKGSMELLADRDPEEARKLLDPVLERMMEAVHRYEGTVNQVMGDGIKALFGAPIAHEDHAVRACYAALRMQDAVRRYSDELRRGRGVEVQIRVGVNSGDVVVRSIGSDLRMDYTAPWARPPTWPPAWSSSRRPAASASPPRHCTWPRASSRSSRSAPCRSRGSPSRSRSSSC